MFKLQRAICRHFSIRKALSTSLAQESTSSNSPTISFAPYKSSALDPLPSRHYNIFSDLPLIEVLTREDLSEEEIVANLLFRVSEVFEEADKTLRSYMIKKYQSEIFLALQEGMNSGSKNAYKILAIYNRSILLRVSPTIRKTRMCFTFDFVFQPILRYIFARPENRLDPNQLLRVLGTSAFVRLREGLFVDLRKLRAVDRVLNGLSKGGKVTFEQVRFLCEIHRSRNEAIPKSLIEPLVRGSDWTWLKVVEGVEERQSEEILALLFAGVKADLRPKLSEWFLERSNVTGLLRRPWGASFLSQQSLSMQPADVQLLTTSSASPPTLLGDMLRVQKTRPSMHRPLSTDYIYLIDSPEKLAIMFRRMDRLFRDGQGLVALSFQRSYDSDIAEVLSFATCEGAFIVDMGVLRARQAWGMASSVIYVLEWLCELKNTYKLVYCAEKWLDEVARFRRWFANRIQEIDWPSIQGEDLEKGPSEEFSFSDFVDLRKPRIKRFTLSKLGDTESALRVEERITESMSFNDLREINRLSERPVVDDIEIFPGFLALPAMTERFLGFKLRDVRSSSEWSLRPLPLALVEGAGMEVFSLVQLELSLRQQGYNPQQVLTL